MTTYKYSNSEYTRKYLGLTQAKELIGTFSILTSKENEHIKLKKLIENNEIEGITSFVKSFNKLLKLLIWS